MHRLVKDPVVDIRQVHDMRHGIAAGLQVAAREVVEEKGAQIADMCVIPHGRPARVHADVSGLDGFESVLGPRQRVVKPERHVSSINATACAAMPAPCPNSPNPSGEVALTLAWPGLIFMRFERFCFMPSR